MYVQTIVDFSKTSVTTKLLHVTITTTIKISGRTVHSDDTSTSQLCKLAGASVAVEADTDPVALVTDLQKPT